MSFHASLEAALPLGWLAPRRMDTSAFCGFREFELLRPPVRKLITADDEEVRSLGLYRAVSGHFSLTTLLQITVAEAIGTVLREPRARGISLYMYWRTPKIFDELMPYCAQNYALVPFGRFMSEPRVAAAVDNQVCRMLLHGDPRIPCEGFIAEADVDAIAADAIARLDTLGFVGVLELGDDAWHGLARLFGVTLKPHTVNVSGATNRPVAASPGEKLFTSDAFALLEQRSAADRIVYDHALTLRGIRRRKRLKLADSSFAAGLVKLENLSRGPASRTRQATIWPGN